MISTKCHFLYLGWYLRQIFGKSGYMPNTGQHNISWLGIFSRNFFIISSMFLYYIYKKGYDLIAHGNTIQNSWPWEFGIEIKYHKVCVLKDNDNIHVNGQWYWLKVHGQLLFVV
jgi:hypothetical protein